MARLRIGSRGSQLALWQASHVAALLRSRGHEVKIETIRTTGDKVLDVALAKVGTKGMFTKEIEEALAEDRVDLAVHSLKDVTTVLPAGFELAAVLPREDARDAFLSTRYLSIEALPEAARVGTSSLRREAQLKAIRPGLTVHPLRGNVDTRLRKLADGEYDAIILAASGLKRLQRTESVRSYLSVDEMCPAAGQGALAIEIREGDSATRELIAFLNDAQASTTTRCERAMLNHLGGGCQVPIGAHATSEQGTLKLHAVVARPDGSQIIRHTATGTEPEELAKVVAQALLAAGAREILDDVYNSGAAVPQQP